MHEYLVVDAFADTPLMGNPVAVFFDAADLPAELMQRIAQEMHLSEVTFVLPPRDGADARVRIFTPVNELPFAGHPLLGTAVALAVTGGGDRLRLETAMGTVPVQLSGGGDVRTAWMRQPVPRCEPVPYAGELLAALGVDPPEPPRLPVRLYDNGPRHVFAHCRDVPALSALVPDQRRLAALPELAANCFAGAGNHWRARMFSPAYGVVEDAATGSAAGPLALHLARHGLIGFGQPIEILQGVELGRSARMLAVAHGDADRVDAVEVGGDGVVVARGTIAV
jgi:trans-2,3-dihydro-3-hydroxyanthranilate isomerase